MGQDLKHKSLLNMKLGQIGMFGYLIFSGLSYSSVVKLFDYYRSQYQPGDNLQPAAEPNIDCNNNNGKLRENSLGTRVLRRSIERSVFLMLHSSPNTLLCLVGILSISN